MPRKDHIDQKINEVAWQAESLVGRKTGPPIWAKSLLVWPTCEIYESLSIDVRRETWISKILESPPSFFLHPVLSRYSENQDVNLQQGRFSSKPHD